MVYLLLVVGFILLIKGADFFVDGSSSVAKLLRVPTIIIGLTVVAFGTSMPEASVSITAAMKGQNGLAVSNVLGSNIFNLLIVLGFSALVHPIKADKNVMNREFPFSILITALLAVLCTKSAFSGLFQPDTVYELNRIGGIILLILFIAFVFLQIKDALKARNQASEEEYQTMSPLKSVLFIVIGIIGIILGGDLVVDSATEIAVEYGLSQTFIGLTIVAMGTSLPELVTSMVASRKGENDLALGNIVGSNIFNILLILGASSAICPITVEVNAVYDMIILIVMSIAAYFLTKSKQILSKKEGLIFLIMYAVYFVYIYNR